ncbi:MAG: DinB family protein [Chloroflexota bacterium]
MPNLKTTFIDDLQAAQAALRARVDGIPETDWEGASANEGWTNKDLLAHLASIDERLRGQVPCAYGRQPWPSDTIDEYNERALARRRGSTVPALREELDRESAATMEFVEGLSEADLAHRFDHPRRGDVSLEEWLRIIPNHIQSHLGDFRAG